MQTTYLETQPHGKVSYGERHSKCFTSSKQHPSAWLSTSSHQVSRKVGAVIVISNAGITFKA